jgi:hypothetical protein
MPDTPINVAYPAADDLHLRIALGARRFKARPSEAEGWVAGACHDPTGKRDPRIRTAEQTVTITEVEPSFERISAVFGGVPRYELEFGKGRPFALTIAMQHPACERSYTSLCAPRSCEQNVISLPPLVRSRGVVVPDVALTPPLPRPRSYP